MRVDLFDLCESGNSPTQIFCTNLIKYAINATGNVTDWTVFGFQIRQPYCINMGAILLMFLPTSNYIYVFVFGSIYLIV